MLLLVGAFPVVYEFFVITHLLLRTLVSSLMTLILLLSVNWSLNSGFV